MDRPFRFGLTLWPSETRAGWQDKVRKLESLGYDRLMLADHLGASMSPMVALAHAAAVTRGVQVGTNVLNNDFYHPALLARDAASLDLLSDGRLLLGVGGGYMESEYAQAGLTYAAGARRLERLSESVTILKHLFAGGPVTFEGHYFQIREHELRPKPLQQPHPPLLIGGDGRRILELAAREADVVGLNGLRFRGGGPPADILGFRATAVDTRIEWLRRAAGDRFAHLELSALVQRVVVTDDRRAAAEQLARELSTLTPAEILDSPYLLIGSVDNLVEQIRAWRDRWGISAYFAFEPAMDGLAPVVARLKGTHSSTLPAQA
jgi:probable F420-dependent oxidoreductase